MSLLLLINKKNKLMDLTINYDKFKQDFLSDYHLEDYMLVLKISMKDCEQIKLMNLTFQNMLI